MPTGAGDREINIKGMSIDNYLEKVKAGDYTDMWSGGFLGMSDQGMEDLKAALKSFINDLQSIADDFNEKGSIEMAFQGTVKDAVQDYIASVKEYIKAFITVVNNSVKDADTAYTNWKNENAAISSKIDDQSQSVRAKADAIKVD